MNKVALIAFNFGKLPESFELWLKSAEYNGSIHFHLFIDDHTKFNYPSNVFVHYCTFKEIVERTKKKFKFDIVINRPYKFCDYRPAFGFIFNKELQGYEFWGTIDLDIILGNIRKFLTDEIFNKYDKILTHDHFAIYRNNISINTRFMCDLGGHKEVYKDVFSSPKIFAFGERSPVGIYHIYRTHNWKMYDAAIVADINYKYYHFEVTNVEDKQSKLQLYKWFVKDNQSNLYQYCLLSDKVVRKEFMYMHLQKRNMKYKQNKKLNKIKSILIVPNQLITGDVPEKIDAKVIKKYNKNITLKDFVRFFERITLKVKKRINQHRIISGHKKRGK